MALSADDIQTVVAGFSAFAGGMAGVAGASLWLARQFGGVHDKMNGMKELLIAKMDDHEKLDIERFGKQDLAIMRIEMRQQGHDPTDSPYRI